MSAFLSDDDVARLTGFKVASKQLRWLRDNGLPCWVNGRGRVIVTIAAVEGRKRAAELERPTEPQWEPDFSALKAAKGRTPRR